jgi:hypothetical protein
VVTQFTIKHLLGFIILCMYFICSVFCLFVNLGEKNSETIPLCITRELV